MIKKFVSFSFLALFLNACATPHVVSVIGPNDSKMNCSQLDGEIAIASNYKIHHCRSHKHINNRGNNYSNQAHHQE